MKPLWMTAPPRMLNAEMFAATDNSVARFLECAAAANRIEGTIGPLLIGSDQAVVQMGRSCCFREGSGRRRRRVLSGVGGTCVRPWVTDRRRANRWRAPHVAGGVRRGRGEHRPGTLGAVHFRVCPAPRHLCRDPRWQWGRASCDPSSPGAGRVLLVAKARHAPQHPASRGPGLSWTRDKPCEPLSPSLESGHPSPTPHGV